ncbi:MAG TPA: hypothetical protein VF276_01375 [Chloroflexia bacterium]
MAEQLVVEVGNENFGPGRARVEVSATGTVRVSNRFLGHEREVETTIPPAEAARLLAQARAVRPPPPWPGRMPVPDEVSYQIAVYDGGRAIYTTECWQGDLRADPAADDLITALRGIVREAANGQIVL